jgi:alpha-amylase
VFDIDRLELDRLVATRRARVRQPGQAAPIEVRVTKELLLGGDRREPTLDLVLTVENLSEWTLEALLGLEWTLTMLGGGGNPSAWWEVDGERTGHDTHGSATSVSALAQGNDYVGVSVATSVSTPATAWWAPVETISNSESGFERVYQGSGLLLAWPLALAAGGTFSVRVHQGVTTSVDRAAEEASTALADSLSR